MALAFSNTRSRSILIDFLWFEPLFERGHWYPNFGFVLPQPKYPIFFRIFLYRNVHRISSVLLRNQRGSPCLWYPAINMGFAAICNSSLPFFDPNRNEFFVSTLLVFSHRIVCFVWLKQIFLRVPDFSDIWRFWTWTEYFPNNRFPRGDNRHFVSIKICFITAV